MIMGFTVASQLLHEYTYQVANRTMNAQLILWHVWIMASLVPRPIATLFFLFFGLH